MESILYQQICKLGVPEDPNGFTVIPNNGAVGKYASSCMFISIAQLLIIKNLVRDRGTVTDLALQLREEVKFPQESIMWDRSVHDHEYMLRTLCRKYNIVIYVFMVNNSGGMGSAWIGHKPPFTYWIETAPVVKDRAIAIASYGGHFEPIISKTSVTDKIVLVDSSIGAKSYDYILSEVEMEQQEVKVTTSTTTTTTITTTTTTTTTTAATDPERKRVANIFEPSRLSKIQDSLNLNTSQSFQNYQLRLTVYRENIKRLKESVAEIDEYTKFCKKELMTILSTDSELKRELSPGVYTSLRENGIIDVDACNKSYNKAIEEADALKVALNLQCKNYIEMVPDVTESYDVGMHDLIPECWSALMLAEMH
jgi:hypothetical protein